MATEQNFLYHKKLLIFGSGGVGKTTLTSILEDNDFEEELPTKESNKKPIIKLILIFP